MRNRKKTKSQSPHTAIKLKHPKIPLKTNVEQRNIPYYGWRGGFARQNKSFRHIYSLCIQQTPAMLLCGQFQAPMNEEGCRRLKPMLKFCHIL